MPVTPHADDVLQRLRREVRLTLPEATEELVEEVAQHLAERWHEPRAAGGPAADADAVVEADLARWRRREARNWMSRVRFRSVLAGWGVEARRAVRCSIRRPAFAVAAVGLTAIAVGATVAAFAVAFGLLWRPLPYPDGHRLAVLWQVYQGTEGQLSYPDYQDLTAGAAFDGATAIASGTGNLRVNDRIERVNMLWLEPAGFSLLGARPILGRLLGPDGRATPNVMISHRLWVTELGADRDVVGRTLWLSGRELTVVGVLAPGFDFELPVGGTFRLEREDLWAIFDPLEAVASRRDVWTYEVLVRLREGSTLEAAQSHVNGVAARLADTYPNTNAGRTFRIAKLADEIVRDYRRPVLLSGLGALVVFATGLVNILMLTSVHLSDRRQELAVRSALGAGAFRIRRQLMTEQAFLIGAGTAAGLLLARVLVNLAASSDAANLPRADAIRLDAPAWIAASVLAMTIAAALALVPWRNGEASTTLGAGGRSAGGLRRTRRLMVGAELALAVTLVSGGASLGLSLARLVAVDPGFVPDGVMTLRVSAYSAQHPGREDVTRFFDDVLADVRGLPGVSAAGAASSLPLAGQSSGTSVSAVGQPRAPDAPPLTAGWQFVTPGYFSALGIRVREGRTFDESDGARPGHTTVISEALARTLFAGQSAVGRRILVGGDNDPHEIIGVVADTRHTSLAERPEPRVYDLFGQHWGRTLFLVAATGHQPAASIAGPMRRAVAEHDPEAPVFQIATMTELLRRSSAPFRLSTGMAGGLALVALVLAIAGVYATSAIAVAERTREVGVRAALGATRAGLVGLICGESVWTSLGGIAIGSAGAIGATGLIAGHLFGAQPSDAAIVIPLTALTVAATAIAATIPAALRAASIDPLVAMRNE